MEGNLFKYVWRHSRGEQLVILVSVLLSFPFLFLSFSLPKSIVNQGIQGEGYQGEGSTQPFMAMDVPASELLTGEAIDGAEALRIGLFHELVPGDKLWARAVEVAAECAQGSPEALQMSRRMLNETIGEHLPTLLAAGAAVSAAARTTESAQEGLRAFEEKRPPQWL